MRAAVLGSPISHSLSPRLHRAAYALLGLPWTYDAVECTAAQLPDFIAGLDEQWVGLSLTMPLKSAVLPLLDEVSVVAQLVGGANTVVRAAGRLTGSNTDVPGIAAALRERGVAGASVGRATVLGAGATARSAVAGLAELGVGSVDVFARDAVARGALVELGRALGVVVTGHPWGEAVRGLRHPLVVSTVPVGVADHLSADVPAAPGVLFDVLYAPWPTPLASRWLATGSPVVGGVDLLVQQAARQVQLMTGRDVNLTAVIAAMRADLAGL